MFVGAVGLLLISSAVTMAVPFGIGKVIDIINSDNSGQEMKNRLKQFCSILVGIFLVGAVANFGRVYLMKVSGKSGLYTYIVVVQVSGPSCV